MSWTAGERPLAIQVGDVIPLPPTHRTCARLNSLGKEKRVKAEVGYWLVIKGTTIEQPD
jgi:hypothetical protein